jgi:hypothetical protein
MEEDMYLYVNINQRCVYYEQSRRRYGPWRESWVNNFKSVCSEHHTNAKQVPVDFNVAKGDVVHVVWAEWSSGDSFGNANRKEVEVLAIYKTAEKAIDFVKLAKEATNDKTTYLTESGAELTLYCGWLGYFEKLDDIHLTTAIVGYGG